jgi:integrase
VASAWVSPVTTKAGSRRFRVFYRLRWAASPKYAGSFKSRREANIRKAWVLGEIAAARVPDLSALTTAPTKAPTLRELAEAWQAARVDVSEGTMQTYRVALGRLLPRMGDAAGAELEPQHVADLVAELTDAGLRKQTIRKTVSVLAMILDHHGVQPNPARDPRVKMPREEKREVMPPSAADVLAVYRLLPSVYRLTLLVLDGTGMRVGELEPSPGRTWTSGAGAGAFAPRRRRRGRPGGSSLPPTCSRPSSPSARVPERPVFGGFGADRFRTALSRACTGAGVALFSPHDLRHRRVSLLHAQGLPWARIGEVVGHTDLMTTARTYTHVLSDEVEGDYEALLAP